ncbi:hypothetical protein C5167_027647 [Papaver somniferum]|uniref:ABC transporter G family member 2-like n=1 Tax=Papaver somniferum TaxID=3469 RepID=UPI000E7008E1|nr:ABC transporter G family member 2-like [Papaver somniferum]RZC91584.1 hypothetical protein C5167_027647 [Papaver somniferum]
MEGNMITALDFHEGVELRETSMSIQDDLEEANMMTRKTSVAPFVLAFNNLTYGINTSREMTFRGILCRKETQAITSTPSNRKMLLNDISGEAREGEILAILGPSGSGKTTLIDALANRISKESLGGSVTMNGETLDPGVLKMISAYVMQDDLLYPMLTVKETLMFSAEFRLPRSLSKAKKMERVETVIDELGLRDAAKTIVGDEGHRGISGGERRRVSIGVGIIHDPILLLLDEPTSGLDSSCAFMVVKVLQRIARSGRIVIMSVHQPSPRVVSFLDQLIFLSLGETVYYGSAANLSPFLSDYGHCVPENEDRTEFMLDLYRELERVPGGTRSMVDFNKSWHKKLNHLSNSEYPTGLDQSLKEAISRGKLIYGGNGPTSFANPLWVEIIVLVKRSLTNSKRIPEVMMLQIGLALVLASIFGSVFWHLDKTETGVQERIAFFAFMATTIFFGCTDLLAACFEDKYIFVRETAYNAYRRSSYVVYRSIIDIPVLLVVSMILASITFWSVGLDGGNSGFAFYYFVIFASFLAGHSVVTFVSGLVSNIVLGYVVVMPAIGLFLLFSGFFIHRDRLPSYWIWYHYISVVKFPYQAMILNQFDRPDLCLIEGTAEPVKSCLMTGLDIVRKQDATDLNKWNCLWITLCMSVFYRILFYLSLLFGSRNKRK